MPFLFASPGFTLPHLASPFVRYLKPLRTHNPRSCTIIPSLLSSVPLPYPIPNTFKTFPRRGSFYITQTPSVASIMSFPFVCQSSPRMASAGRFIPYDFPFSSSVPPSLCKWFSLVLHASLYTNTVANVVVLRWCWLTRSALCTMQFRSLSFTLSFSYLFSRISIIIRRRSILLSFCSMLGSFFV